MGFNPSKVKSLLLSKGKSSELVGPESVLLRKFWIQEIAADTVRNIRLDPPNYEY